MDIQSIQLVFSIIILVMSVVIHEVAHGYAALMQGDQTAKYEGRLTLNPVNHIDPMGSIIVPLLTFLGAGIAFGWAKPVPFNPYNLRNQRWGEAIVAAAGPISNIFIAAVFSIIIRLGLGVIPGSSIQILALIVIVNLGLALFNLIPIPPLDGSKILFSFLPFRFQRFRYMLERYSFLFVLIFVLFFSEYLAYGVGYVFMKLTGLGV